MPTTNSAFIEQSWRWFGPSDPIPLAHIRQAGATGVVTALHHVANGDVWTIEEIQKRKDEVESAGLRWSAVESVPVHEDIKQATGDRERYLDHYRQSLRNLAACGLEVVCYNFMPLLDWTRTELAYILPTGAEALRFDAVDAAVFDLFVLKRAGAETSYSADRIDAARARYETCTPERLAEITRTTLAGLPGTVDDLTVDEFRALLAQYTYIDASQLRANHAAFLNAVCPVADEIGIRLCIHPDDPPFSLFGLPKIASVHDDFDAILAAYDSPVNGITFCTGSLGANAANDLPAMFRKFGHRVHFLHLRNVTREPDGSFYEADHLGGSTDMAAVMISVLEELDRRTASGITLPLPMRPDHGHRILDDQNESFYAGYSAVGRLKGLAELRGLEVGLRYGRLSYPLAPSLASERGGV